MSATLGTLMATWTVSELWHLIRGPQGVLILGSGLAVSSGGPLERNVFPWKSDMRYPTGAQAVGDCSREHRWVAWRDMAA